jgi:hypothetical protein
MCIYVVRMMLQPAQAQSQRSIAPPLPPIRARQRQE